VNIADVSVNFSGPRRSSLIGGKKSSTAASTRISLPTFWKRTADPVILCHHGVIEYNAPLEAQCLLVLERAANEPFPTSILSDKTIPLLINRGGYHRE
jgi:hypothetical protein